MNNITKTIGYGIVNFLIRFIIGGILFMGVKMNPITPPYGIILTLVALITAYVLLRYVMKPSSVNEAITIAVIWIIIALVLDVITAKPIVKVEVSTLLREWQTWTRLLVMLVVAPFSVSPKEIK